MKMDTLTKITFMVAVLATGVWLGYQIGKRSAQQPTGRYTFHVGGQDLPVLYRCDTRSGEVAVAVPAVGGFNWRPVAAVARP